jgi:hypothetical protein
LIARVILKRTAAERIEIQIVWVSGYFSQGVIIPPILRQRDLTGYDTMLERIHQLWREDYRDPQIADVLNREGFRSGRREQVSATTVLKIRRQHQWDNRYQQHRLADKIDSMWTVRGLAGHLGVSATGSINGFAAAFWVSPMSFANRLMLFISSAMRRRS